MKLKEKIMEIFEEFPGQGQTKEQIALQLNVDVKDYRALFHTLTDMTKEGSLTLSKKGRYFIVDQEASDQTIGRLVGNARGFAFFISEDPKVEDVFIPEDALNGAVHDDRVKIQITNTPKVGRLEGEVVDILKRNTSVLVGTYEKGKNFGFVVPDDQRYGFDVFVLKGSENKARNRDKVVVKIKSFPKERNKSPEGVITEVIGNIQEKGIDITSIARQFGLPHSFPKDAIEEAEAIPQSISKKDFTGRKDLRSLYTVTIDGADAKDFDDAISIEKIENGYRLWVHIADVAHYVQEGQPLDKEALNRGNSVYLLDRVIPMLPEALSNGICSLNPKVDRLSQTVLMDIDLKGKVKHYEFYESVINSNHRLIYDDVSNYLEGKAHQLEPDVDLQALQWMEELYHILTEKRKVRGSIDFNFVESQIILNEEGKAIDVVKRDRRVSNRIIEEFMLVTNETVGQHFAFMDIPFIYRIHEDPSEEKMAEFLKILHNFGYTIKGKSLHSKDFQQILEEIRGKKEEPLISTMLLRSLRKARYSAENDIHFGLAAMYYTHFTSPIRRYADLVVHRIFKRAMRNGLPAAPTRKAWNRMEEVANHISETERRAEEAEREVEDMKKAEYMLTHLHEVFPGTVSSLTSFGIFVELENTVEGLVHFKNMEDDYYRFDEEKYYVIGERSHRIIHLGDNVEIKVDNVDVERRQIDFKLME